MILARVPSSRSRSCSSVGEAIPSHLRVSRTNACLSTRHPADPSEPVATAMRRSGRFLWRGATRPRAAGGEMLAPPEHTF